MATSIWFISTTKYDSRNYYVYRRRNGFNTYYKYKMGGRRIAVDGNDKPWVVTARGSIYWWTGKNW